MTNQADDATITYSAPPSPFKERANDSGSGIGATPLASTETGEVTSTAGDATKSNPAADAGSSGAVASSAPVNAQNESKGKTKAKVVDPFDKPFAPETGDVEAVADRESRDAESVQNVAGFADFRGTQGQQHFDRFAQRQQATPQVDVRTLESYMIGHDSLISFRQAVAAFSAHDNQLLNKSTELMAYLTSIPDIRVLPNASDLRNDIAKQIVDLNYQIIDLDYPISVAEKLCLLFCIVIDEAALSSPVFAAGSWQNRTLVADLFGLRNGGEKFYDITDRALLQPTALRDFLEVVYLMLKMGYRGRYSGAAEVGRQRYIDRVERAVLGQAPAQGWTNLLGGRAPRKANPAATAVELSTLISLASIMVFTGLAGTFAWGHYQTARHQHELKGFLATEDTPLYRFSSATGETTVESEL